MRAVPLIIFAAVLLLGKDGLSVQGRSLMESVNHEQYVKGHINRMKDVNNYGGIDIEH